MYWGSPMNKYNGLLSAVSSQYHILIGKQETELDWKTRLVYSICGLMAYASLWDESEEPISIVHLKKRIRSMLDSYKSMYPELSESLPSSSEELEDEITNQFLNVGVVYLPSLLQNSSIYEARRTVQRHPIPKRNCFG